MRDPLVATLEDCRSRSLDYDAVSRVEHLVGTADPWSRDRPLHVTGSALVVDAGSSRVLLRWHHKIRKWIQVGGHASAAERDPWLVACREAREETGLLDLVALDPSWEARPVQVVIVQVRAHGEEPAHEH